MLREEKLRLKVVITEAEKQLEMLHQDLNNVRRNQVSLMDKLKVGMRRVPGQLLHTHHL